jgi:superfamily II DNA/RNA helicase
MTESFEHLFQADDIVALQAEVDAATLHNSVSSSRVGPVAAGPRLAVAAHMATAAFFDDLSVDRLLSKGVGEHEARLLESCVVSWRAYLEDLTSDAKNSAGSKDLVLFCACGMLSKQQNDVRNILRRGIFRRSVDEAYENTKRSELNWRSLCEAYVGFAVLLLVRQANHADVKAAADAISALIRLQKEQRQADSSASELAASNLTVLSIYHLAQATIRTANYLSAGRANTEDERNTNFEPELRRLLLKAEEFMEAANAPEDLIWCRAIASILWTTFDESIWRQARGLSGSIDALIQELASRPNPIFSLLPSQQQALRDHLLDSAQIAVVLQMPTSAGKTLLAEFYILQALEAYKDKTRVLFITPTRALCTQTYRTLAAEIGPLGVAVQQASSAFEEDPFEARLLSDFDSGVIVATPEKVDLFLRAHPDWFQNVKLVVVDEAHLISDKERGVRLELLLANIRREQPTTRFLLLTPFVQNAPEVAHWLGGKRGASISVYWRPSRILVGLANLTKKKGGNRKFRIEWKEPHSQRAAPAILEIEARADSNLNSTLDKVVALHSEFRKIGLTMAMFPSSKSYAEEAADNVSGSDELRFALALAKAEYGEQSTLAICLANGVAFHHSSLSPELRFLIEDLGRRKELRFLAATTTLAQGINFPVSSVMVHAVHKPNNGGDLTPSEFWNIAGRAGRVGLVDQGLVIFANQEHRPKWEKYAAHLSEPITSALLSVLASAMTQSSLKEAYRLFPQLRPFIQYLAHAAATLTPRGAIASLEEILEASFANATAADRSQRRALRDLAQRYLEQIAGKPAGYLKVSDTTGFSSFSFDEIFAKIPSDAVLSSGPGEVLRGGATTLAHLVKVLAWLPELNLALGLGSGNIDSDAVARVVAAWIEGKTVSEIASEFAGEGADRVRRAGAYVFSTVSQTIAWGAHAYIRGWSLHNAGKVTAADPIGMMLPAYIQHGVHTPEAAVASLIGVPRLVAEPMATRFRQTEGALTPESAHHFKEFVEMANDAIWSEVVSQSKLAGRIGGRDVRSVWRKMRGLRD